MSGVDLNHFSVLKSQIDEGKAQIKQLQASANEIEQPLIQWLLQNNKRYIDQSNTGAGPFWTVTKVKSDGTWKDDRLEAFFAQMLSNIYNNPSVRVTPSECVTFAKTFIKAYEKRKCSLTKHDTARQKTCEDILTWLNEKPQ